MSAIHSKAKIKTPLIAAIWEQPEPRALWMYPLHSGGEICRIRSVRR